MAPIKTEIIAPTVGAKASPKNEISRTSKGYEIKMVVKNKDAAAVTISPNFTSSPP